MGKISHEYTNIEGGCQAIHVITFPETAHERIVGHSRHLALEFYNWMKSCAIELT